MSNITFKLDLAGLREILKSEEMQAVANDAAEQIATVANGSCAGYEVEAAHPISFDSIASVRATDFESRKDNSDNNTLMKAAGSVSI